MRRISGSCVLLEDLLISRSFGVHIHVIHLLAVCEEVSKDVALARAYFETRQKARCADFTVSWTVGGSQLLARLVEALEDVVDGLPGVLEEFCNKG